MRHVLIFIGLLLITTNANAADTSMRDPTRPEPWVPENSQNSHGELSLNAVIISNDLRIAVINEQIHKSGDIIENSQIIKIEPSFIVIQKNNVKQKIYLNSRVKQAVQEF